MKTSGLPTSPRAYVRKRACALTLAAFILLSGAPTPAPAQTTRAPRALRVRQARRLATEPFCGGRVAARQLLLKVSGCPARTNLSELMDRLGDDLSDFAEDETLTVSQVGRGHIFLLQSNQRSAADLKLRLGGVRFRSISFWPGSTCVIEHVEPNLVVRADVAYDAPQEPGNEFFQRQWGLRNSGQQPCHDGCGCKPGAAGVDAGVVPAWGITKGSRRIVVGVLDNGVDYTHEDLSNNMWRAPDSFALHINGVTVRCPEGSHGFDALNLAHPCRPLPRGNSHGTHVAGIIGAEGNNGRGVVGVNWEVSLLGLRFMDGLEGPISAAIAAMDFLLFVKQRFKEQADVRVLNNSWGTRLLNECDEEFKLLREKIEELGRNEILFVASAGNGIANNDDSPHHPSNYNLPNVLAVTAIDNQGNSDGVAHGKKTVHLGAPGQSIISTCVRPDIFCVGRQPYCYRGGTSTAAPHAAGAAALVLSAPSPLCSDLRTPALRDLLTETVVPTHSLGNTISGGRLNVYAAIMACTSEVVP